MKKLVVGLIALLLVAINVGHVFDNIIIFLNASNDVVASSNERDEVVNHEEKPVSEEREEEAELTDEIDKSLDEEGEKGEEEYSNESLALITLRGTVHTEAGDARSAEDILARANIDLGIIRLGGPLDISQVNFGVPGSYEAKANGLNALGITIAQVIVTVIVEDTTAPIITGNAAVTYDAGSLISTAQFLLDANIHVTDNAVAAVTPTVDLSPVNFNVPGTYQALVNAQDASGNRAVPFVVNVIIEPTALITMRGDITVEAGNILTPAQILTGSGLDLGPVRIDGALDLSQVNFRVPGDYEATAAGLNALGVHIAQIIIMVHVVDTTAPIITGNVAVSYDIGDVVSVEQFLLDANIHVTDNAEGLILPALDLSNVRFNIGGVYQAFVYALDASGNNAVPFVVTVSIEPTQIITFRGDITVEAGDIKTPTEIFDGSGINLGIIRLGAELDLSHVNFGVPGDYDAASLGLNENGATVAQIIVTVHIVDTIAPVITGEPDVNYPAGLLITPEHFLADANIQVTDNAAGAIVPTVDLSNVNFAVSGIYEAIVHAEDASGNKAIPFVVEVQIGDVIPPVITGDTTITYIRGISRTGADFIADTHIQVTDNSGEIITPTVDLSRINFNRNGVYSATVNAQDSAGNQATPFNVSVRIQAVPLGLITAELNVTYESGPDITVEQFIVDANIKILDLVGVSRVPSVSLGTVDFNTIGVYPVVATAVNSVGTPLASVFINVNVVDTTAPVITGEAEVSYDLGAVVTPNQFLLDAKIKVTDNESAPVEPTVDLSGVNFNVDGIYEAIVHAVDDSGNEAEPFIVKVIVGDVIPPVITGLSSVTYIRGISRNATEFLGDAGIQVTDNSGETIMPTTDVSGINFGRIGVYRVFVQARDSAGNEATPFAIDVHIESVPPGLITAKGEITYEAGPDMNLVQAITNEQFIADAEITIMDVIGVSLIPTVNLGTVDFETVGTYPVVATASSLGGTPLATTVINVTIVDTTAPVITGEANVYYPTGAVVSPEQFLLDANIQVSDNESEPVLPTVDLSGVNFNINGVYEAIVHAEDSSGNKAEPFIVTVTIGDVTPPVITGYTDVSYIRGVTRTDAEFIGDANIAVTDDSGEDITPTVDLSGVDFNHIGVYVASVNAQDSEGNQATPFLVNVHIEVAPADLVTANLDMTYEAGTTVTVEQFIIDANIQIRDFVGVDPVPFVVLGTVDFDTVGDYPAVVKVESVHGVGVGSLTIQVHIVDTTKPIITADANIHYPVGANISPQQFIADTHIQVTDNASVPVVPTFDLSGVNFNKDGVYEVIIRAQDASGNVAEPIIVTITIGDVIPPVITGDNSITYVRGITRTAEEFLLDTHIEAADETDPQVTPTVDLSSLDFHQIGTYQIAVQARDVAGNAAIPHNVTVNIIAVPADIITGDQSVTYEAGTVVTPEQVLADAHVRILDLIGVSQQPFLTLGTVDFETPGVYAIVPRAVNMVGDILGTTSLNLIIVDTTAPVITGDENVSYNLGSVVSPEQFLLDANIHVTDNASAPVVPTVDLSGVNFNVDGLYEVTVRAQDASGNEATPFIVKVAVGDVIPPVITGDTDIDYVRGVERTPAEFLLDTHIEVTDNTGETILPLVDLSTVNFHRVGTYPVSVTARDSAGNNAIPFIINIHIKAVPLDIVSALPDVTYEAGPEVDATQFITDANIMVRDLIGVDQTPVVSLGTVDFETVGVYPVVVSVHTVAGEQLATITVNVNIIDTTPPVITGDTDLNYPRNAVVSPEQVLADAHIQVSDNESHEVIPTVDLSGVNFAVDGVYQAIVNAVDNSGNGATPFVITITIGDITPPVIIGDASITYTRGIDRSVEQFIQDAHIQVTDETDDNVLPNIDLSGVNFHQVGTYTVTVTAQDSAGNAAVPHTVTVMIVAVPTNLITANTDVTYEVPGHVSVGQFIIDANIQVIPTVGVELEPSVILSPVDFGTIGVYPVVASAVNSRGEPLRTVTINVHIVDTTPPVITGESSINYELGTVKQPEDFLNEVNINVTDNSSEDIAPVVDLSGINWLQEGTYPVTVVATDSSGNTTNFNVLVTITPDVTPPVITGETNADYELGKIPTPEQVLTDANISTTDNSGETITPVVDLSGVNWLQEGTYPAVVSATDSAGNTNTFVINIVITPDVTGPTITGDANANYELGRVPTEEEFLQGVRITVSDNSGEEIVPVVDLSGVDWFQVGNYFALVSATDSAGNTTNFDVGVEITPDVSEPTITGDGQVSYEAGQAPSEEDFLQNVHITVSDNSGEAITPVVDLSGVDFHTPGTYPVTVTATDSAGNSTSFEIEVTITPDVTGPVITGDHTVDYELGTAVTAEEFLEQLHIAISDNSGEDITPVVDLSGVDFHVPGTYPATVTATDSAGNVSTFSITVTITGDVTPPVITGDTAITYTRGVSRNATQFIADTHIQVTDNSGETITPTVDLSGVNFNQVGTYQAVVTATDSSGNVSLPHNVTVTITAPPSGLITANVDVTYEVGSDVSVAQFILDANINVLNIIGVLGDPVVSLGTVDFSTVGDYTVVANAVSLLGITLASVNITVHIVDTTAPVITGDNNVSYELGTVRTPAEFIADANIQVTDNSGEAITPAFDLSGVNWTQEGTYPVTVSATDSSGNTTDFVVNVTITPDVSAPVITGDNNVSYELGAAQTPEQVLSDANIQVTDNSGEMIMPTVDLSGVNWLQAGTYPVTVTATDSAGNTSTFEINVTITADTTPPVITGDTNVNYELGAARTPEQVLSDANIAVSDNSGEMITPAVDLSGVNWTQAGTYPVTVTATDSAGNTSTFDISVTITADTTPPVITGDTNVNYELGAARTPEQVLADANIEVSDNSGETITPVVDLSGVNWTQAGTYPVTVTATDSAGNTSTFDINVTITADTTPPVITGDENVNYELGAPRTPEQVLADANIEVSDNSGETITPVVDLSGVNWTQAGTYPATVTATDSAGNTSTFEINVTITADTTPPVITGNPNVNYELGTTQTPEQVLSDANIQVTDNSGEAITPIVDLSNVNWMQEGTYPVTVSATDAAGNTGTFELTLIIGSDTTAPIISVDADVTYTRGINRTPEQVLADIHASVTDNSGETITPTIDLSGVNFNQDGTYTAVVSAQDSAGNQADPVNVNVHIVAPPTGLITANADVTYEVGSNIDLARFIADANINILDLVGVVGEPVVSFDAIDFSKVGDYPVTASAVNVLGIPVATANINVHIVDTEAPFITGNGTAEYPAGTTMTEAQFLRDNDITVSDNSGEVITPTTNFSDIDFSTPGEYTVTIHAKDASGNEAEPFNITVTITPSTTRPVITGDSAITYVSGAPVPIEQFISDTHITVHSNDGETIEPDVDLSQVDFNTPGQYTVIVRAENSDGEQADPHQVQVTIVRDTTGPVITGDNAITYTEGAVVSPSDFLRDTNIAATDDSRRPVNPTVDFSGVDFNTPGQYTAIVRAQDASGNQATPFEVRVTVVPDPNRPVITGDAEITYFVGTAVNDARFLSDTHIVVTSNRGETITPTVDLSSVNFNTPGTYTAIVNAKDSLGNVAVPFNVIVHVVRDEEAPVITGDRAISYVVGTTRTPAQVLVDTHIVVTDNSGETITPTLDLSGVDFNTIGTYVVNVRARDASGNEAAPYQITITITPDPTIPVISGENSVAYGVGSTVTVADFLRDAKITVTDPTGENITPTVDLSGVDFTTAGDYTVTVHARNAAGKEAVPFEVIVSVLPDAMRPVISGDRNVTYEVNTGISETQFIADAHITVDNDLGETIIPTVDFSNVRFNVPGVYVATVHAKDAAGFEAIPFDVTVTITPDVTGPELSGGHDVEYYVSRPVTAEKLLEDAKVIVSDNSGETIIPTVDISGIDFDTVGLYTVTVRAQDSAGNQADPMDFNVRIKPAPVLTITVENDTLTYEVKTPLTPEIIGADGGVMIGYQSDLTMTSSVDMSAVNPNVVGTYPVVVTAEDSYGNRETANLTVHIVDTTAPVISGENTMKYFIESKVTAEQLLEAAGITVSDNYDASVTPVLDVSTIDFTDPGTYPVVIKATDANGNEGTFTINVQVVGVNLIVGTDTLTYEAGTEIDGAKLIEDGRIAIGTTDGEPLDDSIVPTFDLAALKPNTVGEYPVTVSLKFGDEEGQTITEAMIIKIKDETAPEINVGNDGDLNYGIGDDVKEDDIIKDADVTVTDNSDDPITPVVDLGDLDTSKEGNYEVVISAEDSQGNKAETVKIPVVIAAANTGGNNSNTGGGGGLPITGETAAISAYLLGGLLIIGSITILVLKRRKR